MPGLGTEPAELDAGPLAVKGQVHILSGTNVAEVVGLTPGSFADVTGPVFFGLNVTGPLPPFFMTATQSTAILNVFTSALKGLAPASGGGTTNFLRADGTWAAPGGGGGGSQGWDDTLAIDPTSGANNPIVTTGAFMQFHTGTPAASGDIRSVGNLHIRADTTFDIQAGDDLHIFGPDTVLIESTGGSQVQLTTSASTIVESTGAEVRLIAGTVVTVPNGFMRFIEKAASTPSMAATQGLFWVKDTASPGNEPFFTDDANVDHPMFTAVSENGFAPLANFSRLNFDDSTKVKVTVTDLGGRQANIIYDIGTGSLALTDLASIATGTVLANITAGSASPTAHSLTTLAGGGLTYTNVTGIMAVGAGTGLTVNANDVQISTIAADSFFMNATGGVAVPVAVAGATVAGAGLTYTTGGILAVGSSTSITVNANDIQRAALTGDITAAANANATAFRSFAAKSVLANATNAAGVPSDLAGTTAFQHLRVNSANTGLEWSVLTSGDFAAGTVPLTGLATQAAETFLGNFTAGVASPTALAGSTVAGAGLTYTTGGILAVGAGTNVTVNANDIAVTNFPLSGLATQGAGTVLANITAGAAAPTAHALPTLAGAGLVYTNVTGVIDAVAGAGASIVVGAGDIQRGALTGVITAAQDSNTTAFATIATDTFFANITAGTATPTAVAFLTIDSTSIIWDSTTHTFQRAAFTGDVTTTQNSNALTIPNDTVTYAKMQNVSATSRFLGRITAGSGDVEEMTGTQSTTLLDVFTSTLKGLAPLSGGGTTNFLRADGTWAAPPAGSSLGIRDNNTLETAQPFLNFVSSTSITLLGTQDVPNTEIEITATTGAITGAVTASANSLVTAFGALVAKSVLANATNASAVPAALAGSAAFQHLRVNSANTGLEWSLLTSAEFPNNVVPLTALATQAAETFVINGTAGAAAPTAIAGSTVAGAGLTYTTGGILAVGSSTSITVNANDIQRPALTGAITAPANSNVTTMNTGWSGVLAVGATSGANNPIIDNPQFLQFGTSVGIPASGDIRKTATLVMNTGGSLNMFSGGGAQLNSTAGNVVITGGSVTPAAVNITAGTDIALDAGNDIIMTATGAARKVLVNATDGLHVGTTTGRAFLVMDEEATSALSMAAGEGTYWVRNDAPNVPMFTGDDNVDHKLMYADLATSPSLQFDPSTNALRFRKSRGRMYFWEDFEHSEFGEVGVPGTVLAGAATVDGTRMAFGSTNWCIQAVNSSGQFVRNTPVDNHPGSMTMTTGTTSGNAVRLFKGPRAGSTWVLGQDIYFAEVVFRAPSVASLYLEFGFLTSVLTTYTNCLLMYLDNPTDTSIHVLTEEAGVSTDTDTGFVLSAAAWTRFTMIQETVGTVDFYIDDALELSTSSNIPDTETMNMGWSVLTRTAAAKSVETDYIAFESQDLGLRT